MTPQPTTPGHKGVALIQGFEQCRLHAYLPTPNDVPTIGWGTTGPDIHLGLTWTQAECDARFSQDLARFARSVTQLLVGGDATTQNQFDALVDFAYNEGAQALHTSHLLMFHRAGDYARASNQFPLWNTQKHIVLNGLTKRRNLERALYLTP